MALHHDNVLFRNIFGTGEMRSILGAESYVETFMEVEAALARAEAGAGLIPEAAAEEITAKADLDYVDLDRIGENVDETALISMSIVNAWKENVDAGEYIHWGATTQDIMDTTAVLQAREALDAVERDLTSIRDRLVDLAAEHRETPMMGRTHYVHAIPITFGLKVAVWIDEVDRHLERLSGLRDRALVGQFFGATGTLASLGEDGLAVQENLEDELGLPIPDVVWQPARDRFAEIVSTLSAVATTLSKIASTVLFMHRPEVGEAEEVPPDEHVGSSTMPHKRNPRRAEGTVALARLIRGNAHAMTEVMETVDERAAATWYAEYAVVPETFLYAGRILANVDGLLETLEVHPDRMEENLSIHGSFVASERIMMALAGEIGRQRAHDVVHEDAMEALASDREFLEVLLADDRVTEALAPEKVESLADPSDYTGVASTFVDRVVGRHR